mgnify:FL=1
MPVVLKDKLVSDSVDVICEIDGIPIESITAITYKHVVDAAQRVTITIDNVGTRLIARLGGIVVLKAGRNDRQRTTSHNLDFTGTIVEVSPSVNVSQIVAMDYITFLHTSELVEYKAQDLIGEDLYLLAADACDYKDIDTTYLKEGSGIEATAVMALEGLQTRRQFIDKCFKNMVEVKTGDNHPEDVAVQWRYAIRRNNVMDFWLEDPTNTKYTYPIATFSEHSNNLVGAGLTSKMDITQVVNSATYQSSTNPEIYGTMTDDDGVRRFGVRSKLFKHDSENQAVLEKLAYETVIRSNKPTITYNISMTNGEHISIGDYVRIKEISFDIDVVLPVVEVNHLIGEAITSRIVVGTPELTTVEYIETLLLQ